MHMAFHKPLNAYGLFKDFYPTCYQIYILHVPKKQVYIKYLVIFNENIKQKQLSERDKKYNKKLNLEISN
ncbi:hypothetical protein KFK09_017803 [Dendrobium nobile]|uniref:Uncharacterized protein n=1 Tax=Dendrobium nobile TaxID=94219 RepID=A0A8T3AU15_DENNO|nr:hypothetical protein KFK09_017803 [Dendrobium nobile]